MDDLSEHIRGATHASDRARYVLVVMTVASILALAAYWNSQSDGCAVAG